MVRESPARPGGVGDDDDIGDDGDDGDADKSDDLEDPASDGEHTPDEERALVDEAAYVCGSCGEQIVVPLDASAGASQAYVEDCPVCCSPNEVRVEFDEDGTASVSSRPE